MSDIVESNLMCLLKTDWPECWFDDYDDDRETYYDKLRNLLLNNAINYLLNIQNQYNPQYLESPSTFYKRILSDGLIKNYLDERD